MKSRKDIGKTISEIQKKKNIRVKEICKDQFSESTYFRIANGEIDTSIINFDHIIEKLNVTYDEFFFLCNHQKSENHERYMNDIKKAYMKKEIQTLNRLINQLERHKRTPKIRHLIWLCNLLVNQLEGKSVPIAENKLVQYLLQVEGWTRYEIVLFNNCIFSFDLEIINLLANTFAKKNPFFSLYHKHNDELFQLLINVVVCNIQKSNYKQAKFFFETAKSIMLEENSLLEKNILLFWTGFFELHKDKKDGLSKINSALNIFDVLDSNDLFNMHKSIYEFYFQVGHQ